MNLTSFDTSQYLDYGKSAWSSVSKVSSSIVGNFLGFLKNYVPEGVMMNLLLAFISISIIVVASKVTTKIGKFLLYVIGVILLLGIVMNLLSKGL